MGANVFDNLFIFEIANNHQGDLHHGLNLIRALGEVAKRENVRAAVKFQFRHLESFLSAQHRQNPSPLSRRFLSTELSMDQFAILLEAVKKENMLAMCTPFDESSADHVGSMGFDFVKVASCSATDWPLLKKISSLNMPTVASTAGLSWSEAHEMVKLLGKKTPLAIMHCVALYPSENHELRLGRISELRRHFPDLTVGFSTHERPDNLLAVQLAYAQGARLFEKHVGLPTDKIQLNSYSASPDQLTAWIQAWKQAKSACGSSSATEESAREAISLQELKRACLASRPIKKGEALTSNDIHLALTLLPSQLRVEDFREGMTVSRDYSSGDPILQEEGITPLIAQLKNLLEEAGLDLAENSVLEVSHHFGLRNFRENGAFILPLPGDGLKKILVLLPNQEHPTHFHEDKNETFRVLHGSLELELDGQICLLNKGDEKLIPKQCWHRFSSSTGAVIEETADRSGHDARYRDLSIESMARHERKTLIPFVQATTAE